MPQVSQPTTHVMQHTVGVAASADIVCDLLADVTGWPRMFGPTVHAEQVSEDATQERIRLWALANGEVRSWTSRRHIDRRARRITFRQELSQPPVAAMGGEWRIAPEPGGTCSVTLLHDFAAIDDDPDGLDWIERAVDRNSAAELAALKATAEAHEQSPDLFLTFEDGVTVNGPLEAVHAFIARCDLWPERLPHVTRLRLTEAGPGVQLMSMDTKAPDGSVHTTESVRIVLETGRIVYKQTRVPPIMTAHTGEWVLRATPEGVRAISRHTVVVNPVTVPEVLGAGATLADARDAVRTALGTNSLATLRLAKAHTEGGSSD
ncbi:aromatase/cyclase [Streptomyces viridochromogenes]|uniref:aromatase/cyclase n=1 Tax=Streptomyces viridochromogenes TaxID=1938 RepID=UPI000A57BECD|nr:aromatase/cyclase [Streptomyces viridochromogenes]